ncbi:glycosyltransferase involved in cell wall biosynthesis [Methylohalomonas lacus]|uniref:Glycosyltransferase involved in cell wall biosynthesis n=1 Tax=Methylohalomonas lacus TaxID=398773 RepID=A0AAE3HLD5_9GAMM|nr:glycosyltransferase family 2 protein [Methylohalomonas lacus]MCS3904384.1 glycosyltransferase involved in cell wall biosynthesis [Methylohalomonas lacus]
MTPTVSIITPLYNCASFITETVNSVCSQTFPDWEMILIDDCSTDDSLAVAESLANKDDRIHLIKMETNSGSAAARNIGIEKAHGRYIAFIDSDDLWTQQKLEIQLAFLRQTNAPLVYSAYEKIDQQGARAERLVQVPDEIDYEGLLFSTVIATVTAIYDTDKVGRVFMPDIRKRQDYALWLRILRQGGVARGINEPLAYLRKRPGSLSSNKLSAAWYTWRVYREMEGLSLAASLNCFGHYAFNAFRKMFI